jgi:predicted nucleic acid-binding protein
MAQPVIVDTDILIDFGLDRPDAVQTMAKLEENYTITVSVITAMELYAGCRSKKDLKKVDELLSGINIEFVTKAVSEKAFELMKNFRSSHGVEINDMLIAAAAMTLEVKLISKNQKHYTFLPGLDLLKYPVIEE